MLDDRVHCPKCDSALYDLGNLDGMMMTSIPPQWRNTWACHKCKVKIVKIVSGASYSEIDIVKDYEEVEEIETPIQKKRRKIMGGSENEK